MAECGVGWWTENETWFPTRNSQLMTDNIVCYLNIQLEWTIIQPEIFDNWHLMMMVSDLFRFAYLSFCSCSDKGIVFLSLRANRSTLNEFLVWIGCKVLIDHTVLEYWRVLQWSDIVAEVTESCWLSLCWPWRNEQWRFSLAQSGW